MLIFQSSEIFTVDDEVDSKPDNDYANTVSIPMDIDDIPIPDASPKSASKSNDVVAKTTGSTEQVRIFKEFLRSLKVILFIAKPLHRCAITD